MKIIGLVSILVVSVLVFLPEKILANGSDASPKIIIAEVKIDGKAEPEPPKLPEYVSIYNQSANKVEIKDWRVEYAKPAATNIKCQENDWSDVEDNNIESAELSLSLPPGLMASIYLPMTDSLGGSVRLVDQDGLQKDLVGWDKDSESLAPCLDDQETRTPAPWADDNQSIQRVFDCKTGVLIDSDNNQDDFILSDTPGQFTDNCAKTPDETSDDNEPASSCDGIIINEILPNPAGLDSGREFVELYNPTTKTIALEGCQLEITASSGNSFDFGKIDLVSGQYKKFSNVSLPNSAGGTVYLLDSDNSESDSVEYPPSLDDDEAWARFNGGWRRTFMSTPNAVNELLEEKPLEPCPEGQFRNPDTNRCNAINSASAGLVPCNPDQTRNLETNRCRKIDSGSSLKACLPGQIRNPQTNRCRNVTSLSSALKPCQADQFRNPATNRCKKIDSDSGLQPCKSGQSRNPETNRCRNDSAVLSDSSINPVQDIPAPIASSQGFWLAGGSVVGAALYGLWEWRKEAALGFLGIKKKLAGSS